MNLKSTLNIVKNKNYFLENGLYSFSEDFSQFKRIYDNTNYKNYNSSNRNNFKEKIKYDVFKLFFGRKYKVYSKKKIFNGKQMISTSSTNNIKIINDTEVMTYYLNKEDRIDIIDKKNKISKILDTPNTLKISEKFFIEEKINYSNFNIEDAIKEIIKKYIIFYKDIYYCEKELKKQDIIIDNYRNIIQHGDLWEGNILFDNEKCKYNIIDYEMVGERYFLYDFFLYIYNFIEVENNFKLLDMYFTGYYDEILNNFFCALKLRYNKNDKMKYFEQFIINFTKERLCKTSKKNYYKKIEEFKRIKKKYEGGNK